MEIEGDGKDLDNFDVVVLWVDKVGVFYELNLFSLSWGVIGELIVIFILKL